MQKYQHKHLTIAFSPTLWFDCFGFGAAKHITLHLWSDWPCFLPCIDRIRRVRCARTITITTSGWRAVFCCCCVYFSLISTPLENPLLTRDFLPLFSTSPNVVPTVTGPISTPQANFEPNLLKIHSSIVWILDTTPKLFFCWCWSRFVFIPIPGTDSIWLCNLKERRTTILEFAFGVFLSFCVDSICAWGGGWCWFFVVWFNKQARFCSEERQNVVHFPLCRVLQSQFPPATRDHLDW